MDTPESGLRVLFACAQLARSSDICLPEGDACNFKTQMWIRLAFHRTDQRKAQARKTISAEE